ncbi:methyltransferase [Flavobacterium sp. 316]|uniref:Class I SAM-dependent methyltransferase n=1 Tax=Flavobacterium sediminilitoris TaxID=2024526 RepID=A0ABY4HPU8_9FLAO|nr:MULTISPECIES: class I SAM-dependent methyltransferase [Flavobacterium]KIX20529.1 methyltransferase [Flavobacterium sp. 316]UOX34905.1 class I SAM-dependent methyltransferase [Flavobacterium sediminilitoris]
MNFKKENTYSVVKDFSVSGESFSLLLNDEYQILKTDPQPSLDKLPSYYESEDYISHTDGSRTLFEKVYQGVKRNAIRKKVALLSKFSQKGSVLDIGAGTGDFLTEAKNKGWNVTGIEPNAKAKQIAISKGVTFSETLEVLESHSFDVITMWHVLEHVPDLEFQLSELKRLLKPNGTIIIAVPNFKSYDAKKYKVFWAAYDVPRHLWHFSKTSIEKLFQNKNMKLIKVKPMWFDSFYVSLLSEKNKNGKMNVIRGFFYGFISNIYGMVKKEFSSHIYIIKNK